MKALTGACVACILFTLVTQGLSQPVRAAPESQRIVVDMPFQAWAITSYDEGILVFGYAMTGRVAAGKKDLQLTTATFSPQAGQAAALRLTWQLVTVARPFTTPRYSFRLAVERNAALRKTLVALEDTGAASLLRMAWIPDSAAGLAEKEDGDIKWKNIDRVDYHGAPEHHFLSVLMCPSVAFFRTRPFIAGETLYPRSMDLGVWVAPFEGEEEKDLRQRKGALLGKGRRPVLVTWNKRLFCFAIAPFGKGTIARTQGPGRVVGWMSKDGNEWRSLDFKVPPADVFLLDACVGADRLYLACVSNPKRPNLSIVRFDKSLEEPGGEAVIDINKERGIHKKRTVLSNVKVHVVGDKLAVFWEEKLSDGSKQIVIEHPELTVGNAEAGKVRGQTLNISAARLSRKGILGSGRH